MNENKKDNLKKFGLEFQIKCVSALVSDRSFTEQISDIIETDFFESESHKWIVSEIIDYFFKYKELPSLSVFKVKIDSIKDEVKKQSIVDSLKSIFKKIEDKDLLFIKEQFLEFCKNQKLKNAIMDSVEYLSSGNYDKIKRVVDDAMKAGMERNIGHDYVHEVDARMHVMSRKTVKTNWQEIDTIMDGGLGPGELGIIAAPSGAGKSWLLSKIGAEAMKQGKTVLHFTLELNENYVGLRYDSCFTGIDFQNIKENVDLVKNKIKDIPGKLFIKYFPLKTVSPNSLKNHAERLALLGNKPDLIVVDYADILKPFETVRGSNSYQSAGDIYEELRAAAGELQIPIWSASQCGRGSLDHDVVEASSISDSYKKIMTCDFIMSLSRKTTDKVSNTARIHVMKNRFGPDGMTFPTRMNAGCGEIEIFASNSSEGMSLQSEMNDGENQLKKSLKDKWNAMS
jgi:replicative DNA helicase